MNDLGTEVQALRPLLTGADPSLLEIFEEFVEQREFGLALHTVCDFLLEEASTVSDSAIDQIRQLHEKMNIADSCVEQLRTKL